MGLVGFLKNGNEWRENHVVWNIGCGNPDIPSWLSGAPPPPPPPPPKQDSEWPASYIILTQPTAYSVLRYSVTAGAGAVTASPSAASRVVAVAVHWSREPCARAYVLGLLDAPARLCTRSVGCACAPTS